jgi:hypothetical protein
MFQLATMTWRLGLATRSPSTTTAGPTAAHHADSVRRASAASGLTHRTSDAEVTDAGPFSTRTVDRQRSVFASTVAIDG